MSWASVKNRVVYDQWSSIRGVHETNSERTLALDIIEDGDGFCLEVQTNSPRLERALGDDLGHTHRLWLTRSKLWGAVQACRQVWRNEVVDRRLNRRWIFQGEWDLSARPEVLREALPRLAEAGADLFYDIFMPIPPNSGPYDSLNRVGRVLRREMAQKTMWVRIRSDSFYVPWGLIYSESTRDPGKIQPEGFWGYQHLIEHSPDGSGSLGYELQSSRPLQVGLQLDDRIDTELKVPCLAPVLSLLEGYHESDLKSLKRCKKAELREAFSKGPPEDQVLYFCCHAQQEGDFTALRTDQGYITLGDRPRDKGKNQITPSDIRRWLDQDDFAGRPLVFLNACGGGQINSIFYEGFGNIFLGLKACSVVGPQIEVPAGFAGEFARHFFEHFFQGGADASVGRILFKLRREFMDRYHNPLGLTYSLYRGADTFLHQGISRR